MSADSGEKSDAFAGQAKSLLAGQLSDGPRFGGASERRSHHWRRGDRNSLEALIGSTSSDRLLNLAAIRRLHSARPDYLRAPLFEDSVLNAALLFKHRVRPSDDYLFETPRRLATKVILPLSIHDLSLGGYSVFVGERDWIKKLQSCLSRLPEPSRDLEVLQTMDASPSLDPFLIRERLSREGFNVSECYFDLVPADVERMRKFVAAEIKALIRLALGGGSVDDHATAKLVEAMLTDGDDARLELLSHALKMNALEFRDGLFAWRGFMYYKLQYSRIIAETIEFVNSVSTMKLTGAASKETVSTIAETRKNVIKHMRQVHRLISVAINDYNDAYESLTREGEVSAFREFLLNAPSQFVTLGEAMGVLTHISTFWSANTLSHRRQLSLSHADAYDYFTEFQQSLQMILEAAPGS